MKRWSALCWKAQGDNASALSARRSSHKHIQDQNECQPSDSDNALHNRPRLDGVHYAQVEIFLEHPEPTVVNMREHEASCTDRKHHEVRVDGLTRDSRRDNTCGGKARDR